MLTLIAGTSCQIQPTPEQIQCLVDIIMNNPSDPDVVAVDTECRSAFNNMDDPSTFCRIEACINALDTFYRRCGFTNIRLCEF